MLVKRAEMFPVECVAQEVILPGRGGKQYQAEGTVCGIGLPAGLLDGSRLAGADFYAGYEEPGWGSMTRIFRSVRMERSGGG